MQDGVPVVIAVSVRPMQGAVERVVKPDKSFDRVFSRFTSVLPHEDSISPCCCERCSLRTAKQSFAPTEAT
jgi:hypothetical protein